MASKWFFTKDGKKNFGPFSSGQLRQLAANGQLVPADMVFKEGTQKWVTANSISGLFANPLRAGDAKGGEMIWTANQQQRGERSSAASTEPHKFLANDRTIMLGSFLVAIVSTMVIAIVAMETMGLPFAYSMIAFAAGIVVILCIVAIASLFTGQRTACIECGKWWAAGNLGIRTVQEEKCYGLVTRHSHSKSGGWMFGTRTNSGSSQQSHYGGPVFSAYPGELERKSANYPRNV